jgi:hypothetical protein
MSGASGALELQNQHFRLSLSGDWAEQPGSDPQQFVFASKARRAQLTVSYLPMNTRGRNLEQIGAKLLELRFNAERKAAPNRQLFFGEPWTSRPSGRGLQINYLGHDDRGRFFFFAGFITEDRVTSVYGELQNGDESHLRAFYREVLSNFGC